MNCTFPDCESPREGSTLFCASHNFQTRKDERDSKKVKIVKPVKKVSESRAKELTEYPRMKKEFLEEKMMCEINLPGCWKLVTQIHHVSKDAKNFLNKATWKRSCAWCHPLLEDMPAEERRNLGLLTD